MSAPNTDPKTQAKRHKGPLVGIALGAGAALIALALLILWLTATGSDETLEDPEFLSTPGATLPDE